MSLMHLIDFELTRAKRKNLLIFKNFDGFLTFSKNV